MWDRSLGLECGTEAWVLNVRHGHISEPDSEVSVLRPVFRRKIEMLCAGTAPLEGQVLS